MIAIYVVQTQTRIIQAIRRSSFTWRGLTSTYNPKNTVSVLPLQVMYRW